MDTSNNSKIYRPLCGSEIRVVQFRPYSPALGNNKIECKLSYVSLDSSPDFFALSYVWGNASITSTISLDGFDFEVTRNLFDAIMQLRNRLNVDRTAYDIAVPDLIDNDDHLAAINWEKYAISWWIDAISIDQSSTEERNTQVPRMRQLYSTAIRVVIWLGHLREDSLEVSPSAYSTTQLVLAADAAYQAICKTASGADMFRVSDDRKIEILDEVVEYPDRLIGPLMNVIHLSFSWNTRVWTVQEAVLARTDPVIMIGNEVTTLRTFAWLQACLLAGIEAGVYSTDGHFNNAMALYLDVFRTISSFSEELVAKKRLKAIHPTQDIKKKPHRHIVRLMRRAFGKSEQTAQSQNGYDLQIFAQELLERLTMFIRKQATIPHDRIYGLLGLTELPELPEDLLPDYDRPHGEVFLAYTKFIIENTNSISIILHGPNRHRGYPSWVPDLTAAPLDQSMTRTRYQSPIIQKDGCLTVSGVRIGQVISLHYDDKPLKREFMAVNDFVHMSKAWADFESCILQPSSQIRNCAFEVVMNEWVGLGFRSSFGGKVEDLQALRVMIKNGGSCPSVGSCVEALRSTFSAFRHVLLDDGTICYYYNEVDALDKEDTKVGSSAWSLRGVLGCTLLRPREGQSGFIILGQCGTIPEDRVVDSEEFLLANGEETIELY
ncbi:hypothetical protein VTL71DRAFT_11186 [Oculimacula yallundae]|uniref:Heterokaryon incompatibility domain-containing protein n=1 Tax=Oculimacula yallundae TaxID=86028 RepID=A0ABR4CVF9_9HELO